MTTYTLGQTFYTARFNPETRQIDIETRDIKGVRADGKVTFDRERTAEDRLKRKWARPRRREWSDVVPSYYFPTAADAIAQLRVEMVKDVVRAEKELAEVATELRDLDAAIGSQVAQ